MRLLPLALLLLATGTAARAAVADGLVLQGQAAETRLDSQQALGLYLAADKARPNDAAILVDIARQYSTLADAMTSPSDRRNGIETALCYSERARQADPKSAPAVLSLAICHGKLALLSGTHDKIAYSRLVQQEAERAVALDPGYAWAHDILGRWNYEVASLNAAEKFIVRFIYGGLPDASYDQAIAQLRHAVELEPGELAHRIELGFAYRAAGREEEARGQFIHGLGMPCRSQFDEESKARARVALDEDKRQNPS